jgi:hypothetical protein
MTSIRKPPSGVPDKFSPDGKVQHFPGNTILCHLSKTSPVYESLLVLYDKLKASPHAHTYTLLPPESWHMTVMDGVTYNRRKPNTWPSDLPMDAPLEECNVLFEKRLSSFDLQASLPFHASILAPSDFISGIDFKVIPQKEDHSVLRDMRTRLADVLDLHNPLDEEYGFHITLAYLIKHMTGVEKTEVMSTMIDHFMTMPKEFELGAPEFCKYDSMYKFEPLLYLKNQSN